MSNSDLKRGVLDDQLRPRSWDEYVGQEDIKSNVRILIEASVARGHMPEHVLFYGPPGLGKTTLARLMGIEMGVPVKVTSGPAIERAGDLASILTNIEAGSILFIDEIHRLNKAIEEILYPAMESGVLDIVIGKGPSARTIQLDLPPFTLVAATTRISLLSNPLISRFSGGVYRLSMYSDEEMFEIVKRSARLLGVEMGDECAMEVARRSRSTPRTANLLLKRVRDFAQVEGVEKIEVDLVRKALDLFGVDELGLTRQDRDYLRVIKERFGGGPVGLKSLSSALNEEADTIESVLEPYLLRLGFIEKTSRGRVVLDKAVEHLGKCE